MINDDIYENLIPSKAVRRMMDMKNINNRSMFSLIINGNRSWSERMELLAMLSKGTDDGELKRQLDEYVLLQNNMILKMKHDKENKYIYILRPVYSGMKRYICYFREYEAAFCCGKKIGSAFDIEVDVTLGGADADDFDVLYDNGDDDSEINECEVGVMRFDREGRLFNVIPGSKLDLGESKKDFSLMYSYVDVFNPFERGDIVFRVDEPDDIGIVLTSQRYWEAHKDKFTDFNDGLIKVDFISEAGKIRNSEISPVNLDFVQPDCSLPQYDFAKSIGRLIRGNGDIGIMLDCYRELNV